METRDLAVAFNVKRHKRKGEMKEAPPTPVPMADGGEVQDRIQRLKDSMFGETSEEAPLKEEELESLAMPEEEIEEPKSEDRISRLRGILSANRAKSLRK